MTAAARRLGRDPALWGTVIALWALLGLFVLYPLAIGYESASAWFGEVCI